MSQGAQNWMKLDNAAKIYPAAMSRGWTALFRLSMNLTEPVDPDLLQSALDQVLKRYPAFGQRLRRGLFWHYMEPIKERLVVQKDVGNPCVRMNLKENSGYMLRVRYHDTRIAVEFFHVLTDGSGGLSFLKTLVAQYLELRYGERIPRAGDILDCEEAPDPSESEDAFVRYARDMTRSRAEPASYLIPGTEEEHFMHITTGLMDAGQALALAKQYKATLTEFLAGVLILSIQDIQNRHRQHRKHHQAVKICIPVNLRKFYPTRTVRNFASYINPGIEPKYGVYTLEETVRHVHGILAAELDEKLLNAKFATNVQTERNRAMRIVPLAIKTPVMRLAFMHQGEKQTSSTISNLGNVVLPEEMSKCVTRVDFMLGPLKRNRVACGCLSYNGQLILNFTRKIAEPYVERGFFTRLVRLGQHVTIESNQRWS